MTAIRNQPARVVGVERGTAVLAAFACVVFSIGITVLAGSALIGVAVTAALAAGIWLTSKILPTT
ncbi:hypothetical protein ACIG56_13415 [Nocardia fusca]|jgi:hypothetical protein|uniref:hypothetical protein n=1 Tax=Nocardia fusca TaxID=941183 RepID=UPI0037CA3DE2